MPLSSMGTGCWLTLKIHWAQMTQTYIVHLKRCCNQNYHVIIFVFMEKLDSFYIILKCFTFHVFSDLIFTCVLYISMIPQNSASIPIYIYVLHIMCMYSLLLFTNNHFISDSRKMWDSAVSETTDYVHNGEQINHLVAGIKVVTQTGSTSE